MGLVLTGHVERATPSSGSKPGLKPEPSPAQAADQGLAPCFCEPEPYQAEPKPGFLSRAEPCKSLGGSAAVIIDVDTREVDPLCVDVRKQAREGCNCDHRHRHEGSRPLVC